MQVTQRGNLKTNAKNMITRHLSRFVFKLIKCLSIEASSTNALNVITRPSVQCGMVDILLLCTLAPHEGMRVTRL